MAAPKTTPTKLQQDQTRAAIQTTQLVKRLQNYALGNPEANSSEGDDAPPVELDGGRLKAIEILLRKSLPDLSSVDMTTTHEVSDPLRELFKAVAENSGRVGRN